MENEFRILIHTRTSAGFETLGEFYVGTDEARAVRLFRSLKGSPDNIDNGLLIMELSSICRGLPLDIQMIHCTLDELAENCRTITKHVFNSLNFGKPSIG